MWGLHPAENVHRNFISVVLSPMLGKEVEVGFAKLFIVYAQPSDNDRSSLPPLIRGTTQTGLSTLVVRPLAVPRPSRSWNH